MKLSQQERLTLLNQYKILYQLTNEDHYKTCARIVSGGFVNEYRLLMDDLYEELTIDECHKVNAIFDAFTRLEDSISELKNVDDLDIRLLKFRGFDHRDNFELVRYGKFLVSIGRWANFSDRIDNNANSSMQSYNELLTILEDYPWKGEADAQEKYLLSREQLQEIIAKMSS